MNPKVDAFLKRQDKWRAEFVKLREILLDSGLTEEDVTACCRKSGEI